jgi:hypothetical protein
MQVVQYAVQYSAGLLCVDSLVLMSLDAAGTNDKHTLRAVARRLPLSSRTAEWAELVCWQIAMPLASRQDIVARVGKNDYGWGSVIALCAVLWWGSEVVTSDSSVVCISGTV